MATSRIDGDLYISGSVSAHSISPSDGTVKNASVVASASIDVTKLDHLHKVGTDFGIADNAAPGADVYKVLFVASGAATIRAFKASLRDTGSSSDVKFNLYKAAAGAASLSTVIAATIDFTHGSTDNTPAAATLSSPALVAGDRLVAFMDYTSATGVLGPWAWVEIDEAAN